MCNAYLDMQEHTIDIPVVQIDSGFVSADTMNIISMATTTVMQEINIPTEEEVEQV